MDGLGGTVIYIPVNWCSDRTLHPFAMSSPSSYSALRNEDEDAVPRRLNKFDAYLCGPPLPPSCFAGHQTVITAELLFATLPTRSAVEELVRSLLGSFDALSGRPSDKFEHWVPCAVDPKELIFEHEIDGGPNSMQALVEQLIMQPIRHKATGPWWEVHRVYNKAAGASPLWGPPEHHRLIVRIEHACGDGIALSQVLSKIAGTPAQAYKAKPSVTKPNPCALLCDAIGSVARTLAAALGPHDTSLPINQLPRAQGCFGPSAALGPSSCQRHVVHVPEHSLELIKRIKDAASASSGKPYTINDVVFAATAGALRRYCLEQQPTQPAQELHKALVRALVPVAFPRPSEAPLQNDWTFVSAELPLGAAAPLDRLTHANDTFRHVKSSLLAPVAKCIANANYGLPTALAQQTALDLL